MSQAVGSRHLLRPQYRSDPKSRSGPMAADQHEDDPEVLDETKKDREEAEQAKALNAVTDNVRQHL